jgi:phenylalanyl-tRNA synthetase beta chain
MKVPLKWLKDYVKITLPVPELAKKLTLAGFEVSEIISTGGNWENVAVGEIKAINPHPNADKLRLATVNLGDREQTVVCGAPNLFVGDKIAFASVGARMKDAHTGKEEVLKTAKIRGVESSGMICSEMELGISQSHEGILVLNKEAVPGTPLADFMGQTVLNIDITANRPDGLSVAGIAREAAAICREKANIPESHYAETGEPVDKQISIEIKDSELCPRYCATLIKNVKIKESPAWLQERLIAGGQRPINNIVDITNYIMLEYGQPLHSFDYDRLKGQKIIVRRAVEGEKFFTLDTEERILTNDMLVIADGEKTVAIGGVMGGLNSQVSESTTSILLEAASFKAASLHLTSRKLNLMSEASHRFERGISAGLTIPALKHATQLMAELGEGTVSKGIIDVYPGKKELNPISTTAARVKRLLGVEYSINQISEALTAFGIENKITGDKVTAVAPYWRSDIKIEEDIIEEVLRYHGYDQIPTTLFRDPIPQQNHLPAVALRKKVKETLAGFGLQEVMTYTMTSLDIISKLFSEAHAPEIMPPKVVNPMTTDQEYMRFSLRGNLLTTLAANQRIADDSLKIFEVGKVFISRLNDLPEEPEVLCGLMTGNRYEQSWIGGEGAYEFYDVKGVMEGLFEKLNVEVKFEKSNDHGLHPDRQANIIVAEKGKKPVIVGTIGEVHPKVAAAFDIKGTVCLFEIEMVKILPYASAAKVYKQIPRFPSIVRDLALVVDAAVPHQKFLDVIKGFPLITGVELFDVYTGNQVASGKKSMAYRLTYQLADKTLTDETVNKVQEQVLKKLTQETGAVLRG